VPGLATQPAFGGFFRRGDHIRRVLELAGYKTPRGLPEGNADLVIVRGTSLRSWFANLMANYFGRRAIWVEEPFLCTAQSGPPRMPLLGLMIDRKGAYFDTSQASELEDMLNHSELDSAPLQARAKRALQLYRSLTLSNSTALGANSAFKLNNYVLVVDQPRNDISIRCGGANAESFARMLAAAKTENPQSDILVTSPPKTILRQNSGHFSLDDTGPRVRFVSRSIPEFSLINNANKVYCVTSPTGFNAIIFGHRPRIFGRPFYGGWGLSDDERSYKRRPKARTKLELFIATMLLYPKWFDPYRNELCSFETAILNLKSLTEAWLQDRDGYTMLGIRRWKRGPLRRFFYNAGNNLGFVRLRTPKVAKIDRGLVWAGQETPQLRTYFAKNGRILLRLEDGFIRSRGLGADLVPPMSLVVDDLGIYYDPSRESRLENLLNASDNLDGNSLMRAGALRELLIDAEVSKYNTGTPARTDNIPAGRERILIPGQVEDDASIKLGAGNIRRNLELLRITRQQNPDAFILYKPHPDVEAHLRPGHVPQEDALRFADMVLNDIDAISAINACDKVCTITSLLGFEALIRGKHVTCHGLPFYAGWGQTTDLGPTTTRRTARPSITAMIHCVLIAYPRYFDPKTGLACPVEVVVERLGSGEHFQRGVTNKLLSKLQRRLAPSASIWR